MFLYIAGKMLAKIEKSLHIINKAYWHMICHSFYRDSVIQRKPVRQQTGRDWRLLLTRRETGFFQSSGYLLSGY
ncbi:hypothetical protein EOQ21_02690 [Salmonella bongori serovar 48:i:-]|nr:hypothetical protein [Salmonella bongori serovar 48:i:-]